jgi:hypothetical protein
MHNHRGCFVSEPEEIANAFSGINLGIKRRGQLVVPINDLPQPATANGPLPSPAVSET